MATLGGFEPDDPEEHRTTWFRPHRGVEKFWDKATGTAVPERARLDQELCVEIGLAARFDHDNLAVDLLRYFHDDNIGDAFEEGLTPFPPSLLNDIGFYVLPSRRTWELTVSFVSELFRRAVTTAGADERQLPVPLDDNYRCRFCRPDGVSP